MPFNPSRQSKVILVLAVISLLQTPVFAVAQSSDLLVERPCGPTSLKGPIRYFFPQGSGKVDFRPACVCHDNCYEDLNRTQKQCDDAFRDRMFGYCESARCRLKCRLTARLMYISVRLFGAGSYRTGQAIGAARREQCNVTPARTPAGAW